MSELTTTRVDDGWGQAVVRPVGARWRGAFWLLAIFCAYTGAFFISLLVAPQGLALFWLPNAVLVTALLRFRPRDWPYVYAMGLVAQVVGNLTFQGVAPHHSLYIGVINAVEATLVVWCASSIAGGRCNIGLLSIRGASAVVVASVTVPALTGIFGALGAVWAFDTDFLSTWRSWWFGDSLGLLVGVPIGVLFRDSIRSIALRRSGTLALGGCGAGALLWVLSTALAATGRAWEAQQTALATAVLLSLTFGAVGAPLAAVLMAAVTLVGLSQHEALDSVVRDQTLLFVVVAAFYAIAAATESAGRAMDQSSRAKNDLEVTNRGLIALHTELQAAQQSEALLAAVVQSSDDAIISVTADGVVQTCNPGAYRLLGYSAAQILGQPAQALMPPSSQEMFDKSLRQILVGERPQAYDTQWRRTDETLVDVTVDVSALQDASGELIGYSLIARDITAQVQAQRQLERLARYDSLTGLTNRAETIGRLESALGSTRTPGTELGVLFCDVDRFKAVNDTWGHNVGDVVLSTLADRIRGCVRHCDTVGRTGGDEILVLLPGLHSFDEATQIAEKIRYCAAEPIQHSGSTFHVTLSIGATIAVPGESVLTMTARADAAMYQAKRGGGNSVTCI